MPTLYGEGEGAFRRLQEEIMRRTPDQSLCAWIHLEMLKSSSRLLEPGITDPNGQKRQPFLWNPSNFHTFLAPSLDYFLYCKDIEALSHDEVAQRLQLHPDELPTTDYTFTPHGIRTQLPVIPFSNYFPPEQVKNHSGVPFSQWYLVILGCGHKDFPKHLLARICYTQSSGSSIEFLHSGWIEFENSSQFNLLPLSPAAIVHLRSSGSKISIKTLYIPQPERDQEAREVIHWKPHETIKLVLLEKTRRALSAQGYTATLRSPDDAHPYAHSLTLSHGTDAITIDYQHTLKELGLGDQELTIKAHVKMSGPAPIRDTPDDSRISPMADSLRSGVTVSRNDRTPWDGALEFQDVELGIPSGPTSLTVKLGLTFAKTNHYLLRIELKRADPNLAAHTPVTETENALDGRRSWHVPFALSGKWRTWIQKPLRRRIGSQVRAQVDAESRG